MEPWASRTASDTKFSEAISSRLRCWRPASSRRSFAMSGSTSASRCMRLIESGQLLHPARVPATGEWRRQPGLEDLPRAGGLGDASAEGEHVGVVVLAAHAGHVSVEAGGGAGAGYLVGG